jgi:NAD-dependent dihydropyrimidine dehydrogenase PreA subunit
MDGILFYFSGTGNSRFIAERFASTMRSRCGHEWEVHSIEEELDVPRLMESRPAVGFCYPIYGSSVPRVMREFVLRHKTHLAGKKLVIFCTQLIFSGDGARALTELFRDIPCEVVLAEHFPMPNNVCNLSILRIRNGNEISGKLRRASLRLTAACRALCDGETRRRGFTPLSHLLGLIQRPAFLKMEKSAADKIFIDGRTCTLCGLCVKECPTKNLFRDGSKIAAKGVCTLCYRCINHCPQKAIAVWLDRKPVKQYRGPEG